jgi:hypothetical protein
MAFQSVSQDHFALYAERMAQSLGDKLFFADLVEADVFVDFGCADGTLLAALSVLKPQAHRVGYDLSEIAIKRASAKVPGAFFSDWDKLTAHLEDLRARGARKIALIASSVLHEVYAYGGEAAGTQFWKRLRGGPFDTFILRDMTISGLDIGQTDAKMAARVRAGAERMGRADLLEEFEARWGSIEERRTLAHYLLKYRYVENWARELEEDYLPITRQGILGELLADFDAQMIQHHPLPFLQDRVREDFGVEFPCPTHLKLICHRG